jgi:hypothetical protein
VHVTYKGPIKSMRLTRDNPVGTITFAEKWDISFEPRIHEDTTEH